MDKAVLKTLIYADLFKFPLKAWEIQKWLISKNASLSQVEKSLQKLTRLKQIENKKGYYFLKGHDSLVGLRTRREVLSGKLYHQLSYLLIMVRFLGWIKLVGVSGGLAMNNPSSNKINLFIVTSQNRLWLSRIVLKLILNLVDPRDLVKMTTLISESELAFLDKNIYLAHEILQLRILCQRNNIYDKILEENVWVQKFLPNWIGPKRAKPLKKQTVIQKKHPLASWFDRLELVAWYGQRYPLKSLKNDEIFTLNSLCLYKQNYGPKVLSDYQKRIKKIAF